MPASGDRFVEVEDLGKRYGDQWAVRHADFGVEQGEIFGIVGPNGAGKTTLMKILSGLLAPTEGRARVGDWSTAADNPVDDSAHRQTIGYLPEASALYEDMTPVGYLRFFADLYDVPRDEADRRIEETLDDLDLAVRDDKKNGDLSKGMKRKVALARSLVNDPRLLIYDEPASGLDPVVSQSILELLESFRQAGKTILMSAHNLHHIEQVCDRVLILLAGRVRHLGTLDEIRDTLGRTGYRVVSTVDLDGAEPVQDGYALVVDDLDAVRDLEDRIDAAGGRVVEIDRPKLSLEEIFLKATEGEDR